MIMQSPDEEFQISQYVNNHHKEFYDVWNVDNVLS